VLAEGIKYLLLGGIWVKKVKIIGAGISGLAVGSLFADEWILGLYNTSGDKTMIVSNFHDITEAIKQSRKIEEAYLQKLLNQRYQFKKENIAVANLSFATAI